MAFQRIQESFAKSPQWKEKRDFDTMIAAITNVAVMNKIDVKTYNHEQILNFVRKHSKQINDEFKILDKKRVEKSYKSKGWK